MKRNQSGFIEIVGALFVFAIIAAFFLSLFFVRFKTSNEVTSGIVYNTTNNHAISGNTTFSVRASVDTYTNDDNKSSYCLPPNSPYSALVNKAAADKNVKVVVNAHKYFAIQSPFTCRANITVTEVK